MYYNLLLFTSMGVHHLIRKICYLETILKNSNLWTIFFIGRCRQVHAISHSYLIGTFRWWRKVSWKLAYWIFFPSVVLTNVMWMVGTTLGFYKRKSSKISRQSKELSVKRGRHIYETLVHAPAFNQFFLPHNINPSLPLCGPFCIVNHWS